MKVYHLATLVELGSTKTTTFLKKLKSPKGFCSYLPKKCDACCGLMLLLPTVPQ
jgi:hypothetical protein